MSDYAWDKVSRADVIEAIHIFLRKNPEHPAPRNTFLIYEGNCLPAKHIRGMAYEVAFGRKISKTEYSGGLETAKFFDRLGFEVVYQGAQQKKCKKDISTSSEPADEPSEQDLSGAAPDCSAPDVILPESTPEVSCSQNNRIAIRIGLYLQGEGACTNESFHRAMTKASSSDFDILVFPEDCYFPDQWELEALDCFNQNDRDTIDRCALKLSKSIHKAVVLNTTDYYGTIYSIYANADAEDGDTLTGVYIKHTMTEFSAFDISNYADIADDLFTPILYKGIRIGMTICYDCNHSIFSRLWGLKGVDLILNSTGGDVIYDKWYKYNKVRAIENHCYNFVTMGSYQESKNPHGYVYSFNREGKELPFRNLMTSTQERNKINTIYVFDTADDDEQASVETSISQQPTINKNAQYSLTVGSISDVLNRSVKLAQNLYTERTDYGNIIFCVVDGMDILQPEKVLPLLYHESLKQIPNKKYILVNRHHKLDEDFYQTKLSVLLKVRAMENFCAVILESDTHNHCYQTGNNRTAQLIQPQDGTYSLDLSRMSGPEAIWKNKQGMRGDWRTNFEWLIHHSTSELA